MHAPTGHNASDGKPLHKGDTVQMVLDANVGTNAERWYGWITDYSETHVYVQADCWYDVNGASHAVTGVHKVHPQLLRSLAFH